MGKLYGNFRVFTSPVRSGRQLHLPFAERQAGRVSDMSMYALPYRSLCQQLTRGTSLTPSPTARPPSSTPNFHPESLHHFFSSRHRYRRILRFPVNFTQMPTGPRALLSSALASRCNLSRLHTIHQITWNSPPCSTPHFHRSFQPLHRSPGCTSLAGQHLQLRAAASSGSVMHLQPYPVPRRSKLFAFSPCKKHSIPADSSNPFAICASVSSADFPTVTRSLRVLHHICHPASVLPETFREIALS